jgi:hypothetical protein
MEERQQFTDGPGDMYILEEPEDKARVEIRNKPRFYSLQAEFDFHVSLLAFKTVKLANQQGWDKESLLAAITAGKIDGFILDPPVPEGDRIYGQTAYLFDDRDFGDRLANRILKGFYREPRVIDPVPGN